MTPVTYAARLSDHLGGARIFIKREDLGQTGAHKVNNVIGQGGPLGDTGDRRCYFLADSTFKGRDKDAVAADEIEDALRSSRASAWPPSLM